MEGSDAFVLGNCDFDGIRIVSAALPWGVARKGLFMKKITVHQLTFCGILAAIYAVLTISTSAISYGPIQFRIAEALCILPFFHPAATVGLTLGCLIANLFSTVSALDMIVGTAATLLACLLVQRIRKPWLVPLPVVLVNAILVGAEISIVSTPEAFWEGFLLFGTQVGAGELVVMYVLGLPLLLALRKNGMGDRISKI